MGCKWKDEGCPTDCNATSLFECLDIRKSLKERRWGYSPAVGKPISLEESLRQLDIKLGYTHTCRKGDQTKPYPKCYAGEDDPDCYECVRGN